MFVFMHVWCVHVYIQAIVQSVEGHGDVIKNQQPIRGDWSYIVVTSASCNSWPTAKTTNANVSARW